MHLLGYSRHKRVPNVHNIKLFKKVNGLFFYFNLKIFTFVGQHENGAKYIASEVDSSSLVNHML